MDKEGIKLLALTHSLSEVDGVGRYAVSVLKEAQRFCSTITVHLARKHRGLSWDLPRGIGIQSYLPPDYFMYMSWPKFFLFMAACLPRVVAAARKADVIHCLCDYPFSVLAWAAGKTAGKPVIVSGHGTYSVAPFRFPLHRYLIKKSYGGVDAVLFGSDFARSKFEEKLRLPNVRVVDYGIDVSEYTRDAAGMPAKARPPYLLSIGEVKERKGYAISMRCFVEAAPRHPELTYAVVGHYVEDDPYFRGLTALLEERGLKDRVRFLGNVTEEEKRSLLAHCEAFILCPKESAEGGFEALGLVYLEAGASGVPVIGTLDSGAVCAIEHGVNGFLMAPDKPGEGADAVTRLMEDPLLKRRMGEEGRAMALKREWRRVGERLERIYKRLVSRKDPFGA